jgi:chemotaxis protein CheX
MSGEILKLMPRLDYAAAAGLTAALREKTGHDLRLDASEVTHIGAMGLQVLRAAAQSWAIDGKSLGLTDVSEDCADQLSLFGFDPDSVTQWEEPA